MSQIDDILESARNDIDALEDAGDRKEAVSELVSALANGNGELKEVVDMLKQYAADKNEDLVKIMHNLANNAADQIEEGGHADFDAYKKSETEKFEKIEAFAASYGVNLLADSDYRQGKNAQAQLLTIVENLSNVADDKYDDLETMAGVVKASFPERKGNPLKRNTPRPGA